MTETLPGIIKEFNQVTNDVRKFLFVARSSNLQRESVTLLKRFIVKISSEKERAIAARNDDFANLLLGCECLLQALISELEMLILLKEEQPDSAWDYLSDAQLACKSALQAHKAFEEVRSDFQRLKTIEKVLFPPQHFMSFGGVAKVQICSICRQSYENCMHIKGKPYLGEFCNLILDDIEIDHVSLVDKPANKRARIFNFSTDQGVRNLMTWEIESQGNSGSDHDDEHKSNIQETMNVEASILGVGRDMEDFVFGGTS